MKFLFFYRRFNITWHLPEQSSFKLNFGEHNCRCIVLTLGRLHLEWQRRPCYTPCDNNDD